MKLSKQIPERSQLLEVGIAWGNVPMEMGIAWGMFLWKRE